MLKEYNSTKNLLINLLIKASERVNSQHLGSIKKKQDQKKWETTMQRLTMSTTANLIN